MVANNVDLIDKLSHTDIYFDYPIVIVIMILHDI